MVVESEEKMMKKRILGILLCLCMVLTIFPALAFAEGDGEENPVCTCETACALGAMNADCPVCGGSEAVPESCGRYTAPAETPAPAETSAPAEDSVCTCETACALGAMNDSCPVCGTDGTVPESCGRYTAPAETPAPEDSAVVRQDLDDTVKQAPADDTDELQTLLDGGGEVKLEKDYTISETLTVGSVITLDLNGHVIRMTGDGSVIAVYGGLTLTDSDPTATHADSSLPAGGVITGGYAAEGGGVYVEGEQFTMNAGTIFGCRADRGGGVYANRSIIIMNGGVIEDCSAASNGQAVYMKGNEFIANSGTIKGTVYVADNGSIVTDAYYSYARFYDQVTVESGTIRDGIYCGGIAPGPEVISGPYYTVDFNLNGGSGSIPTQYFVNTPACPALRPADPTKDGYTFAGWYRNEAFTIPYDFEEHMVDENLTLYAKFEDDTEALQTLLDGDGTTVTLDRDYTISETLTVSNTITLDLNGHVIRMNGSGSVIQAVGIMTLTDSNPTATHADPSLPAGGVITGGNAAEGGGVYVAGGLFTMNAGTIFGCRADRGGGVYVEADLFTMNGGVIEDCSAASNGQAVYMKGNEFIANSGTIKGTVYVADNGRIVTTADFSYARFYDQVTVESGTIRDGTYYGGIAPGPEVISGSYWTVSFDLNGGSGSIPTQYFVNTTAYRALKPADPTKDGYTFAGWYWDEALTKPFDFKESPVGDNLTLHAKFEDGTEALQKLLDGDGTTVTLDRDYTITKTLTVGKMITLDLAGHVIRMTGSGSVIQASGTMTLTDSNPTATHADSSLPAGGVITGGHATDGGGVYATGDFTMTGGTIYNCTAGGKGGGVYAANRFTMTGGAIDNCTAGGKGGGVYCADQAFTMTGGAIKGCKADFGGGVFAQRGGFMMTGGAIEDCIAYTDGQAVYIFGAGFLADGGTVEGTVYVGGNGLIAHDAGTSFTKFYDPVTIKKGTIRYGVYYGGIENYEGNVDAPYHTVDFNLGGGSGSVPTQFFVGIDTAPALQPADPTKDGYTFAGWFTDKACTTAYDFNSPVTENRTLYAGFKEATYTITYDPGEYGTGSIPAGTKEHGKDFTLSAETFTREGYVQYGWRDRIGGVFYPLGGAYSLDADVTLYPAWSKIETLSVPFTTTVTLGGSAAPGETVFDLELVDAGGNPVSNDAVTVSGSVTTNGAGSYTGALTLTGPVLQIQSLIIDGNGLFVRQVDAGAAGWTLDGRVWGVALDREEADTTESGLAFSLRIYPVKLVDGKYTVDQNASPVEQMLFTNVYTHTHRYTQHFNETEHWDECPCGDVVNKAPHSFTKHHDETDHWDECDCGYAKNKEPHSFGEWVVKTPATATAAGLQERECTGCDYVQSSPIPPLGHTHSYTQQHDETHHWDECACGDVLNLEDHIYGDWTVTKRPTGFSKGVKARSCVVCGYQQTAEIPPLKPTDSPATGDNSHMALWFALLFVSGAGVIGTTVYGRKKRAK